MKRIVHFSHRSLSGLGQVSIFAAVLAALTAGMGCEALERCCTRAEMRYSRAAREEREPAMRTPVYTLEHAVLLCTVEAVKAVVEASRSEE